MTMLDSPITERLAPAPLLDGIEHLLATVSSPPLVRAFAAVEAMPEEERVEVRRQLASVASFRALGVPVPKELRVCLRAFEEPGTFADEYDLDSEIVASPIETETWCISLGIVVCVTWGKSFPITSHAGNDPSTAVSPRVDDDAVVPGGASVAETRASLRAIASFSQSSGFRAVVDELYGLPHDQRGDFVRDVVLDREKLARRGARPPDDLVVQRSSFADGRPTLFCVSHKLSRGSAKVTVTFDSADPRQT